MSSQAELDVKRSQFKVTNVSVRVLQSDSIQLTATKLTRIDPVLDSRPTNVGGAAAWRRSVTSIQEIVEDPEFQPQFNEVDTIGVLVKVAKVEQGKNSQVSFCQDFF